MKCLRKAELVIYYLAHILMAKILLAWFRFLQGSSLGHVAIFENDNPAKQEVRERPGFRFRLLSPFHPMITYSRKSIFPSTGMFSVT